MKLFLILFLCLMSSVFFAQDTISAGQTTDFVDKIVLVKGKVASFRAAKDGKNTNYLNIDKPYPNAEFTVVLSNNYLLEKSIKIEDFDQKNICVYGKITIYKNDPKKVPQMFNPDKIIILR